MAAASELFQVAPGLLTWQAYDRSVKADLFSSALATSHGVYLVDPIPLENEALAELLGQGPIAGIVVTNANHLRAAPQFAEKLAVPIFAGPASFPVGGTVDFRKVADGEKIDDELQVIGIDGAVAGEIVLYYPPHGGTLIVGDALINFEPYGFTFLPEKYCSDEKEMRRLLRKLLTYQADRMLFAHGTPLTSQASKRLERLLTTDS